MLQASADVSKRRIETLRSKQLTTSFHSTNQGLDEKGFFFHESRAYEALYHYHITSFQFNYFICNDSNFANVHACGHPGVKG